MHSQDIINNPPELLSVVQRGIAKLMVRKLRFPPPPNDIPIFCEALTEDLVRANKVKHFRIIEALEYIGRTDKDFPQPARVIEVMTLLAKPTGTYKELAAPGANPAVRDANMKKIKEMMSDFADKKNPNKKKFEHFNHDKHMKSETGTMQLTDYQLIELQRRYSEADGKAAKIIAQQDYMKEIMGDRS